MGETFVVLDRIWHGGDLCHYERGATVKLDHMDVDNINILLDKGVVVLWEEGEPWPIPSEDEEEAEEAEQVEFEIIPEYIEMPAPAVEQEVELEPDDGQEEIE